VSASDCSPLTALSPATHVPALLAPARQSIVLSYASAPSLSYPNRGPRLAGHGPQVGFRSRPVRAEDRRGA
jgi:hypothetical protein